MIILHIGLHKAGSTTVQTYLRDNAEVLAEAGILYPAIGRDQRAIAHHMLAADVRAREPKAQEWAAIVRLAEDNPDKRVVISSEGFQSADPTIVKAMLDGHPVKVFCYHRDAAQRMVSVYGHGTKNGFRSTDFDQVFENQFSMKRTYIGDTLKGWAEAFGGENVRVRSLHPSCLTAGDLMSDVFDFLGLGSDAESRLGLAKVGSRNVSPGWKALEVLRALYDDLGPGRPDPETSVTGRDARGALLKRALQAEARLGLQGRGQYLSEDQMRRSVELEDSDIASMQAAAIDCRLRPITMEGFEPREFLPEFSRVPGDEAAALLRDMLSSVVRDYVLNPPRRFQAADKAAATAIAKSKVKKAKGKAGASAEPLRAVAGSDPIRAAKQQAKAERLARQADFDRVKAAQKSNRAERQAAPAKTKKAKG
jgi:hypothetical protein